MVRHTSVKKLEVNFVSLYEIITFCGAYTNTHGCTKALATAVVVIFLSGIVRSNFLKWSVIT